MPLADNVASNPGSGAPVRCLSDGTNEWAAGVAAFCVTVSPGANTFQLVDATHGLPVAIVGTVPVTIATAPALVASTAVIGHVVVDAAPTTAVTGTFWQATQPVSGTFFQATQPVSGTFFQATQPVSIAAPVAVTIATAPALVASTAVIGHVVVDAAPSTAVTGTFWQATQPVSIGSTVTVSAASLPLPTGASTAAKQPALGTAGASSADVLSVQGIASGTAMAVSLAVAPALVASSAVIGHVIVDTAPTTAVTLAVAPALVASSAVIGHVIVDTAPTTAVTLAVAPALVASSAVIGHVIVDTAPTTAVTIATAPALVASAAVIGKVGIDHTTPGTTDQITLGSVAPTFSVAIIAASFATATAPGTTVTLDLTAKSGALLYVRIGRNAATALTRSAYVAIRRQCNNLYFFPSSSYDCVSSTAAVNATTVSSGGAAAATTMVLASGTGYAAQQVCCANLSGARIEFFSIDDLSTATITVDRSAGFRITHNASDVVTNGADTFAVWIPGGDIWEITPINNSGQTVIIAVDAATYP